MSQWKNTDDAANAVSWVARSLGMGSGKTAQAANNTALYQNTTSGAFVPNQVVGQFAVDVNEAQANPNIPHAGYVLKRTGTGGRAGRVTYEVLVASGSISNDTDAGTVPNYAILITSQPAAATSNSSASQVANFRVTAGSVPAGATLSYKWQANTGSGFANVADGAVYGNTATANLAVVNTTGLNGAQFRVNVSETNSNTVTSTAAVLTVTT